MYEIPDCDVDSHAVAYNLAESSVDDVVKGLNGAFVLVWHDARDNSMNIIRNTKRPLHMAQSMKQDTIFFASEGPMLDFLGKRIGLELGPIYFPKEGQHLKWLPDTELTAPQVKDLDLHSEWSQYSNGYEGYGGYSSGSQWYDREGLGIFDYDGDDNWRNDGARSRGNVVPFVRPEDDKVFLGGRKKAIPMLMQEELLKYGVVVEDRLAFSPRVSTSISKSRKNVFGMVNGKKAILYGLGESTAQHMNRTWTVRPLAVYVRPSGEPMLVCKLVSTIGPTPIPQGTLLSQDGTVLGYEKDENGEDMKYKGAFGAKYGETDWCHLVAAGCGFCGKAIAIQDHYDVTWINNGTVPLCIYCEDDAYGGASGEVYDTVPYNSEGEAT